MIDFPIYVPPLPDDIAEIISRLRGRGNQERMTSFIAAQERQTRANFFIGRVAVSDMRDEHWIWLVAPKRGRLVMTSGAVDKVLRLLIEEPFIPFGGAKKFLYLSDAAMIELRMRLSDDDRIRWEASE